MKKIFITGCAGLLGANFSRYLLDKGAYCDHTKAKDKLNFIDDTNIDVLIEDMFIWAMKQPKREVKKIEYEVTNKIYSYWK